MKSDRGLMLWAVLVGIGAGLMAVFMKQAVGGLRQGMFAVQSWLGGSWFLALGPILGLWATHWVVRKLLNGSILVQAFRPRCMQFRPTVDA